MENSKRLAKDRFDPAVRATAASATAGLMLAAIPLLTFLDLLLGSRWPVWGTGAACALFVVMHGKHAAPGIRRTSLVLALVTAALLPAIDAPLHALERGIRIGGLIASLLVTVNMLSRAALGVPRVRRIMASIYQLPSGQRYLGLALASQFFGGLLGLAGITMMMEMAASEEASGNAQRISSFCAISRGYAALSLWSPMYSNMSIVLALYTGTEWVSVLPYALAVSALLIALGAVLERIQRTADGRSGNQKGAARQSPAQLLGSALPVILAMIAFVAFMVLTSHWLGVPIAAVIIASAPAAARILNLGLGAGATGRMAEAGRTLGRDFLKFQAMAGEVMLFLASGCAGTVMASAIPPAWIALIAQSLGGSPFLGSLFVSSGIVLLSATAIHPMLGAVLVASSLTPQLLGLPVIAHLCAVLVGWGLAIIVTPFSVISIMASRMSGIPILAISLRANLLFVVLSLSLSALVLGSATRLLQP